jgi:predicted MFS family arabinose efflux permease
MSRPTHPALFFPLLLPFGLVVGYSQVVTQYSLDKLGLAVVVVTAAQQTGGLPHTIKIFWAPALDARGMRKAWFLGSIAIAALTLALTVLVDAKAQLSLYTAMLFLANAGVATSSAAVDALMATTVPKERKGAAAGWSMAGNLGGTGIGGALALRLTEHLSKGATAAALAAIMLACSVPVLFVDEPKREAHPALEAMKRMARDLWQTARSREGWTGLVICLSPVGAGAAINLFAGAMHKDYSGVGENEVEWVTGMLGGVVSAVGCLAGGWLADRMNRRLAYALSGLTTAVIAVVMAFGPLTKDAFTYGTLLYQFTNGISYAAFVAFVLEMIGHDGPVATKYTLFVAASNAAISYTAILDGWGYDRAKVKGLFLTDAGATVTGILVLLLMMALVRKKPEEPAPAA